MSELIRPAGRMRKDVMLVMVCLVALAGGVVVYRSFAGKEVSTTQPGVVPAAQVSTGLAPAFRLWSGGTTSYRFEAVGGLQYCFWGGHDPGATVTAKADQDGQLLTASITATSGRATDEPLACFLPIADGSTTATVTLKGAGQVTSLHITQP
ncbi:MAG TPA: hypothetical protein VHQ86_01385 [Candidatus Saccharimonadia bacterium]|nr:hypothetical protein [Candidatus Saccharimonadia bacterium]